MARETVLLCRACRKGDSGDRPEHDRPDMVDFEHLLPDRPRLFGVMGDGFGDGMGGGVRAICQGCGAFRRLRLLRR